MSTTRMNAVIVGVLFIMATVFGVIAAALFNPIVNSPDYLVSLAANQNQISIVALFEFAMAMSCAGVGIALYPILKKFSPGMAIGTVGFRVIESVMQVLLAVIAVSLLALSVQYVKAGNPAEGYFQATGAVLKAGSDWMANGAMLLPWCIAAVMYYSVFFKFRLIPRWLSGWGLIGICLTLISSVMMLINPVFGDLQTAANMPIALQEMVMAVWLIVKGFTPSVMEHASK